MSASTYGSKSTPITLQMMRFVFKNVGGVAPGPIGNLAYEVFCTPMKRSKSDFRGANLPEPELFSIPFRSGKLQAYAWGSGPIVLGVHGWESSAARYSAFVKPLTDAGYRVVLVDGHAHGASSGWKTDAIRYGDGTKTVIDAIGPVYAVIAHSFGGATTVSMLDRYPEVNVERVVLIAALTTVSDAFKMFGDIVTLPEPAYQAMVDRVERYARRSLRTFDGHYIARNRTEPALIIHDEGDRLTSFEDAKVTADAWPGARFYPTNGLGHRRILKDQRVIDEIMGFLKET